MNSPYIKTLSTVPSLSRAGYIQEPKAMASKLFDYYMLSLYSQSTIYYGSITSLAYALYVGGDVVEATSQYIATTLADYYGHYYKEVNITVRETSGEFTTKATIELSMILGDGVNSMSLDGAIKVNEGVIDLSNTGGLLST